MSDILADYREWRDQQPDRIGTHSDRCHMWERHERCMIHRLAKELERVSLADEEREAIETAINCCMVVAGPLKLNLRADEAAATLRGLLERTKCTS